MPLTHFHRKRIIAAWPAGHARNLPGGSSPKKWTRAPTEKKRKRFVPSVEYDASFLLLPLPFSSSFSFTPLLFTVPSSSSSRCLPPPFSPAALTSDPLATVVDHMATNGGHVQVAPGELKPLLEDDHVTVCHTSAAAPPRSLSAMMQHVIFSEMASPVHQQEGQDFALFFFSLWVALALPFSATPTPTPSSSGDGKISRWIGSMRCWASTKTARRCNRAGATLGPTTRRRCGSGCPRICAR